MNELLSQNHSEESIDSNQETSESVVEKTLKQLLLETLKNKQYDKAETLFNELTEKGEDTIDTCTHIAQSYHRLGQAKRFQEIAGLHLLGLLEKKQYQKIYDLTKIYIKYVPDGHDFHEPLVEAIQNIYSSNPNIKRYMRSSGLLNGNKIKEELTTFETFIYCDEGEIFEHHSWGIGVVKEVNSLEKKVIIDFPSEKNKTMTFQGVYEFLKKVPHNHFKAMKIRDIAKLRTDAKENPAEFVKFLIQCYGDPLKANEIKNLFVEILPQDEWGDWWKKAKDVLRFDSQIELKDGLQAEVKLRIQQKDFYDDLIEQMNTCDDFSSLCNVVRIFIKHKDLQPPSEKQLNSVLALLKNEFDKNNQINPSKQIKYYYLYNEIAERFKGEISPLCPSAEEIIKSSNDLPYLLLNMPFSEYQIDTAKKLVEIFPPEQWKEIFSQTLYQAPAKLASFMGEKLLKNDGIDYLNNASYILYQDYEKNPETFIWIAKQILHGDWEIVSTGVSHADLLLELIHYLELLRHRIPSMQKKEEVEKAKKLQSQIRSIINEKKFFIPLRIFKSASLQDAKRIMDAILSSPALTSTAKQSLSDLFKSEREDIKAQEKSEEKDMDKIFYVTKESFEKKQQELEHILTVEIPKNSKDIQVAREKGDLRENAEYDAAKNKQGLLMTQVSELKELMHRARIINIEIISNEAILVGTKFNLFNHTKQCEESYTLLGPWDAKPEQHIISYLSPFGNQFLNHKVGDKFTMKHTDGSESEYEVLKIENAFRQ